MICLDKPNFIPRIYRYLQIYKYIDHPFTKISINLTTNDDNIRRPEYTLKITREYENKPYICYLNQNHHSLSAVWSKKQINYFMSFCKPILRHLFKYEVLNIYNRNHGYVGSENDVFFNIKKIV